VNKNKSIYRYEQKLPVMLVLLLATTLLGACATPATQEVPSSQPIPTTTGQGGMDTLPVARAKSFLADNLNINKETIQLVDAQTDQWPDTCLGVQQPGIMCAMHVVDGYRITLSANDQSYEVHSNLDGSQIVLVPKENQSSNDQVTINGVTISDTQIIIRGSSTLPDGSCVNTELLADGTPLSWWPGDTCISVEQGEWELKIPIEEKKLQAGTEFVLHAYQHGDQYPAATIVFDISGPPLPTE
jgi:archaellum component FlaF (FlaF/FlaG flagellin family)